ncbi:MAG TPA: hypothetical protein VHU89_02735 [Acidobacteriaceae bacterium]|jgi:hypothetical protein|nr:hypothetical protein [Acidobacteriaceae bacterium]
MTPKQAWDDLLELVRQAASVTPQDDRGRFQWMSSNRLILIGRYQVQARFVAEPNKYAVFFGRFGEEIGDQNFEQIPGTGERHQKVWTAELEISGGEAFWRFSDGTTLKSEVFGQRAIAKLREFYDEYANLMRY